MPLSEQSSDGGGHAFLSCGDGHGCCQRGCEDITWEFGPEKDFTKLLEYEWGLEELFRMRPELCGICQYHRDMLPSEAMREGLLTHPIIFINETLSRINPHYAHSGLSAERRATNPELDEIVAALCQVEDTKS